MWLLDNFSKDRAARYASALELNRAYRGTVMLLSDVLEFEDEYTAQHSRSVVDLVNAVADELGIAPDERQELEFAAMLHDVGKISIPKEILHKPSRSPTASSRSSNTTRSRASSCSIASAASSGASARSCAHATSAGTARAIPTVSRGQIPISARIVFACDAYNAMTTDQPYCAAMPHEAAVAELRANTGAQFDPKIVTALIKVAAQGAPAALTSVDGVRAVLAGAPVPQSAGATS